MVQSQSAELKRLGVPFFGLRPDLIASEDDSSGLSEEGSKKVTKKQVMALQRDMLQHLVDMYGD